MRNKWCYTVTGLLLSLVVIPLSLVFIFDGPDDESSEKRPHRLDGKAKKQSTFSSSVLSYTSSLFPIPIQTTSLYDKQNMTKVTFELFKHYSVSNDDSSESGSKKPATMLHPSAEFSHTNHSMLISTQTTSSYDVPNTTKVTYKPVNHHDVPRRPVEPIRKAKNTKPVVRNRNINTANNEGNRPISSFDSYKISKSWKLKYMGGKLHGLKSYEKRKLYTSNPYKRPTICTNRDVYQRNGSRYMEFICPLVDQDSDHNYCCGEKGSQWCCRHAATGKIPTGLFETLSAVLVVVVIISGGCWYRRKRKKQPTTRQTCTREYRRGTASEFSTFIQSLTGRPQRNEQRPVASAPPSEHPLQNDPGAVRDRELQNRLMYGRSGQPEVPWPLNVRIPLVTIPRSSVTHLSVPSEDRRTVNNRLMYGNRRATDSNEPLTVRMPLMSPGESHSTIPTEPRIEHSTRITPGSAREQEIINRLLYRRPLVSPVPAPSTDRRPLVSPVPAPSTDRRPLVSPVPAPSTDRPATLTNNVTIRQPSGDRRSPTSATTRDLRVHIPTASDAGDLPPTYAEVVVAETPPPQYSTLVDVAMPLRNIHQAVPSAPSVHDVEGATSAANLDVQTAPPPQYSSVA